MNIALETLALDPSTRRIAPAAAQQLVDGWQSVDQRSGTEAPQAETRRLVRDVTPKTDALMSTHDEIATALDVQPVLDRASLAAYFDLASDVRRLQGLPAPDGVEAGAIGSVWQILYGFMQAKWPVPSLAWHGGDAVVLHWTMGGAAFLFTITDGEVSYSERRGVKIVRRGGPCPVDSNWASCLG